MSLNADQFPSSSNQFRQGTSQSIHILAVHGFLGEAHDWDPIKTDFQQCSNSLSVQWQTPHLFSRFQDYPLSSFEVLTQALLDEIKVFSGKRLFIGYSLGGRIGLHLLQAQPELFDHFIFISTHPGLLTVEQKQQRQFQDEMWAQKFRQQDWKEVLKEWNQQAVFQGSAEPERPQQNFERAKLALVLQTLSLSNQFDARSLISKHKNKITWIVGAKDSKFKDLSDELYRQRIIGEKKELDAGHRVLFERPHHVTQILNFILENQL